MWGTMSQRAGAVRVRRDVKIVQAIDGDTARTIVKDIKAKKMKKVQVAIQGEQLRISSPSKDALQEVMQFLRDQDYGIELQFGNFR